SRRRRHCQFPRGGRRFQWPAGVARARRPARSRGRGGTRPAPAGSGIWPAASRARVNWRLGAAAPPHSRRSPALKKSIVLAAALATVALAVQAQQPLPQPGTPKPAALSDALPIPPAPAPKEAAAWLLMDYATGQVLAGENIHERREPASITKVMTSYVIAAEMAAGKIHENDPVMMTENAWRKGGAGTDGSYSGFPVNQTAPLVEMEKGMVVQSGNDAAIALAEHVAGSEEAFAQLMNAYAKRIGMNESHFMNPHGLPEEGHYSTAYDLAL